MEGLSRQVVHDDLGELPRRAQKRQALDRPAADLHQYAVFSIRYPTSLPSHLSMGRRKNGRVPCSHFLWTYFDRCLSSSGCRNGCRPACRVQGRHRGAVSAVATPAASQRRHPRAAEGGLPERTTSAGDQSGCLPGTSGAISVTPRTSDVTSRHKTVRDVVFPRPL